MQYSAAGPRSNLHNPFIITVVKTNLAARRINKERDVSLKWIVFDAVGTVIFPTPDVATVYHAIGQKYGSQRSRDAVKSQFRSAFQAAEEHDRVHGSAPGATSEEQEVAFWRSIVTNVLTDVTDFEACFRDLFEHFAQPSAWACFDDVEPTLTQLKAAGYRLAIASNFDRRLHPVMAGHPALRMFETRVISSEVGCRKPGAEFFTAILRMTAAAAHEIVLVGDDLINDVQGAKDSGLPVIHLDRNSQLTATERQQLKLPTIRSLSELLELVCCPPVL